MNFSLIRSFIADQAEAKDIVYRHYGVMPNTKAREWVAVRESIREEYQSHPFADKFYPHGFGLELAKNDLYIDYDYSEEGYPDGFDKWRLYAHLMGGDFDNNGPDDCIFHKLSKWFDELVVAGKIMKKDNLYYLE